MTFEDVCVMLREAGIEDYRFEARVLLEEFCGYASENCSYDCPALERAVQKRAQRYPLQYIIGKWEFCGFEFCVSEDCLIPRPDTEIVVEQAIKLIPSNARVADLCAGSGCIGISLLKFCNDAFCDAVELYPKTLDIAKKNAEMNCVLDRYAITLGDVLNGEGLPEAEYDVIISNPPYIKSNVVKTLSPEVMHEPKAALDGGEDGLIFYRAILDKYAHKLKPTGVFLFEIGYDQARGIIELCEQRDMSCKIIKDLGGRDRVALIRQQN
ncbi:MAG: peptide chain release factor N(5)-glutamine methyltransferase [Ruminococcaceae bacterium]|nr:peptide chain release factor N(5)-glutamine methyltransferase [Oscillospiraceae bacterium]